MLPFKNKYVLWDDDTTALSVLIDEYDDVCIGCETDGGMLYTYAINEYEAFAIIEHLITNGEISLKTNDSVSVILYWFMVLVGFCLK